MIINSAPFRNGKPIKPKNQVKLLDNDNNNTQNRNSGIVSNSKGSKFNVDYRKFIGSIFSTRLGRNTL